MARVVVTGISETIASQVIAGLDGAIGAELDDASNFYQLFSNTDVVVHLDSQLSPTRFAELLDAVANGGAQHFVVASSAAVYGAWPHNAVPLTEEAPLRPNPGFTHAVEVAERERAVAQWRLQNPKCSVAVLRFAMLAGTDRVALAMGRFDWHRHAGTNRPIQVLHVDDAVSAAVFATKHRLDGVFNVSPSDFVSEGNARGIAGGAPRPALPRRVAHIANDVTWRRRKYRSDFAAAAHYFEHPWVVSNERMRASGWAPSFTSEEVVASYTTPTLWNRLNPQRRRDLINASLVGGGIATSGAAIAVGAVKAAQKRKR